MQVHHSREATLAKALAPEDIRPGDFVTPLFVIAEVPSYWWFGGRLEPAARSAGAHSPHAAMRRRAAESAIGLPAVRARENGRRASERSIDLRKCQLARLDQRYAKRAWKAYKKAHATRQPPMQ